MGGQSGEPSGVGLVVAKVFMAGVAGAFMLQAHNRDAERREKLRQGVEASSLARPRPDSRGANFALAPLWGGPAPPHPGLVLAAAFPEPGRAAGAAAVTPHGQAIKLFNGKDLANFYTWLGSPGKGEKPLGKNQDPEKVFSVTGGMIRISGKVFGGLITEKEYSNYHLVTEFKWGEQTWPPREKATRDSGILLHGVGPDGAAGGVWLESIECQMIEGGTGDLILVAGKGRPELTARAEKRHGEFYYDPGAPPVHFDHGRVNWFGRDPGWKDVKGFRGARDLERPVGKWNRLECVCNGDKITNILNGTVVNAATGVRPARGKILFQSEGAEVFFRRIELLPLTQDGK